MRAGVCDVLGRRLHDLRISVIDMCNLRCTYCMPAGAYHERFAFLKEEERLTLEEIARLTRLFATLGVSKARITGGEPLLRKDLPRLIAMLREIDGVGDLALTTNGVLLAQHAEALKEAGLERVTVSLDTLDERVFDAMSGRSGRYSAVLEGIAAAEAVGLAPIKINAVVERGINDHTVMDLVERFRGTGHVVRFIEFMDVGNCNHWGREQVVASREILEMIQERYPLRALEENYHGEVASRYEFCDGAGEIGFISSVTEPFCGSCTRARLSTDGRLLTCLFAGSGIDLRGPMRDGATDDDLLGLIAGVWGNRTDRYSELRATLAPSDGSKRKIEMYQIGG
ncbi:MAG: GTP 3',8-cyclase MoaA [Candidatus Hydrogenedentes bacterium]|nr:GTP 3',8-cyclase MoaA [Candidatus Hydrogenedentota bacterium]